MQEQVTVQEIPEIKVIERNQEQIEKQIEPERSEEQIGDIPIPRITAAHAAPSPVSEYVVPAPVVNFTAPAPVMKDTTSASAVFFETPIPVIESVTPAPVVTFNLVIEYVTEYVPPAPAGACAAPTPTPARDVTYATPAHEVEMVACEPPVKKTMY